MTEGIASFYWTITVEKPSTTQVTTERERNVDLPWLEVIGNSQITAALLLAC